MKINKIPTGFLFSDTYSKGELETLSIGDYGKEHNIKADFLGYTKEINGVENRETKPLTEKWVMTLSTQYGCPMSCIFCDCPKLKFRGNASIADLEAQFVDARNMFPEVTYVERLNVHFARMGEPAFNAENILRFSEGLIYDKREWQERLNLRMETVHPVFTTSMPLALHDDLGHILSKWCLLKNDTFNGQAGLQISVNSTEDTQRDWLFNGKSCSLEQISRICYLLPEPVSRKYCLNFAYATDSIVDAKVLSNLFDKDKFMCKITPIHNNTACRANKLETVSGYESYTPYKAVEESLKAEGFDVLVFVPSMDEENGLVTCGNLALANNKE